MRRHHVASTLIRRHFYVMCRLGRQQNNNNNKSIAYTNYFSSSRFDALRFVHVPKDNVPQSTATQSLARDTS